MYVTYHTNKNWRKCLEAVAKAEGGISTYMVAMRTGFTRQQAYGFLSRMQEQNLVRGRSGIWTPIKL